MEIDKPHKSFDEQIEYLINEHHLKIDHSYFSMSMLKSMSYYDLINGYKDIFMTDGVHYEETTIEDLFQFSFVDKTFQSIIFKYSILVETRFRYILANIVSEEFGETQDEYLSISKYKIPKEPKRRDLLTKTLNKCKHIYNPTNPTYEIPEPTLHYLRYKTHIPPWILFKNVSFSTLINLYSFLPDDVMSKVSDELIDFDIPAKDKNEFCNNALTIVRQFRNKIAHDLKFISYNSGNYCINPSKLKGTSFQTLITTEEIKVGFGRNDHFALLLCVSVLLNCIPLQMNMVDDLNIYFHGNQKKSLAKYLSELNIPADYVERMAKYVVSEVSKTNK